MYSHNIDLSGLLAGCNDKRWMRRHVEENSAVWSKNYSWVLAAAQRNGGQGLAGVCPAQAHPMCRMNMAVILHTTSQPPPLKHVDATGLLAELNAELCQMETTSLATPWNGALPWFQWELD